MTRPTPMRVLAIAGSLRRNSWNRRLLESAASMAPSGMHIDVHGQLADIPLFNEDLEAIGGGPEAVWQLRAEVAEADGLLIATPEYNQSMPGVLKNAIDWLSRALPGDEEVLAGKPVAIIGASSGRWGTRLAQHAVRQTLCAAEACVMPAPMLFIRDVHTLFDGSGKLVDPDTRQSLERVLDAFVRFTSHASRIDTPEAEEALPA